MALGLRQQGSKALSVKGKRLFDSIVNHRLRDKVDVLLHGVGNR